MLEKILNFIFLRPFRAGRAMKRFVAHMEGELSDEFLETLLGLMGLVFCLSPEFRRNIEGFSGIYVFRTRDGAVAASAVFSNGRLKKCDKAVAGADIEITFRDGRTLMDFFFAPKPDVLTAMLKQDITLNGNLNYLYKFAYTANHLRLKVRELLG
jgi:hypothetical protein